MEHQFRGGGDREGHLHFLLGRQATCIPLVVRKIDLRNAALEYGAVQCRVVVRCTNR
jgi:hypothetical protein